MVVAIMLQDRLGILNYSFYSLTQIPMLFKIILKVTFNRIKITEGSSDSYDIRKRNGMVYDCCSYHFIP